MDTDADERGRFVQTAPVNRTKGHDECDGILIHVDDADLRACGVDPDSTDYVEVRITEKGNLALSESRNADGARP